MLSGLVGAILNLQHLPTKALHLNARVMDVPTIIRSINEIVQISKSIISCCHFYIDGVKEAPSDLRVILIEVSALKGIAKSLQYLTKPGIASSMLLDQLTSLNGPIGGCKKALTELEKLIPVTAGPPDRRMSKRQRIDAAVTALAWPLKTEKAKRLLQEIMQHKATINLALAAEFVYVQRACTV